ncbi:MAG: DUF1460 domain-containing protein [Bacteroides sp.]|nr:DUF1460 domain-containing protein [Bacteroides sp.]
MKSFSMNTHPVLRPYFFILFSLIASCAMAAVRVHCENCRQKATEILEKVAAKDDPGERIILAARELAGTPTGLSVLQDTVTSACINLHELSPLDFTSTALAFAKAAANSRNPRYEDFAEAYVNISRRKGLDGGFASRLLYGADWTVDNVYRGNVQELTDRLPDNVFKTRSFDHFTSHRQDYAPLRNDSAAWEDVRMVEMGYRSHKVPYLRKQTITKKDIREHISKGDIIILLGKESDRDIWDMGFIDILPSGEMRLIHSDPAGGEIKEEEVSLERFFKLAGQYFTGYRLLHPTL